MSQGYRYSLLHGPGNNFFLGPSAVYVPSFATLRESLNPLSGLTVHVEYSSVSRNPATGAIISSETFGGDFTFTRSALSGQALQSFACGNSEPGLPLPATDPGTFYVTSPPCCPFNPVYLNSTKTINGFTPTGPGTVNLGLNNYVPCRGNEPQVFQTPVDTPSITVATAVAGSSTTNAEQTITLNGDVGAFSQLVQLSDGTQFYADFDTYDFSFQSSGVEGLLFSRQGNNGLRIGFVGKYGLQAVPLITLVGDPGGNTNSDGSFYAATLSTTALYPSTLGVTFTGGSVTLGHEFPLSTSDVLNGSWSGTITSGPTTTTTESGPGGVDVTTTVSSTLTLSSS